MFDKVQPCKRIKNLDSLYYSNVDYTTMIQRQFYMEKDATKISKKMTKHRVARLIDHVLASNMRSMTELALVKGPMRKFKAIFKSQQGKDTATLSSELEGMKKTVKDFKVKIVKKDNQINDLQASVDSLELKISDGDEEIIKKDQDIVQITRAL